MLLSCGVIIINDKNEVLLGHSTGNKFYDIPKGACENEELRVETAIRECKEETGLELRKEQLQDIGVFAYNKYKNLHLFICHLNIKDLNVLECNSFFENRYTKKECPEFDGYILCPLSDIDLKCTKNMANVLKRVFTNNLGIKENERISKEQKSQL